MRNAIFGYNKAVVDAQMRSMEDNLQKLREENDKLRSQCRELIHKNEELTMLSTAQRDMLCFRDKRKAKQG